MIPDQREILATAHVLAPKRGDTTMTDSINAFVPGPAIRIDGVSDGPLGGLTFAAKDLFDVAGLPTGGGNHDWARANPIPTNHAWAVQALLDAGATLIGKTITDEVSDRIVSSLANTAIRPLPQVPLQRSSVGCGLSLRG